MWPHPRGLSSVASLIERRSPACGVVGSLSSLAALQDIPLSRVRLRGSICPLGKTHPQAEAQGGAGQRCSTVMEVRFSKGTTAVGCKGCRRTGALQAQRFQKTPYAPTHRQAHNVNERDTFSPLSSREGRIKKGSLNDLLVFVAARATPAAAKRAADNGGMFYGTSVWDPVLIIAQARILVVLIKVRPTARAPSRLRCIAERAVTARPLLRRSSRSNPSSTSAWAPSCT